MKRKYWILQEHNNDAETLAEIWEHEKFGLVVVFKADEIHLDARLLVYDFAIGKEIDDKEVKQMIIDCMPVTQDENKEI